MKLGMWMRELGKVESDIDGGIYENDLVGLVNALDRRSDCLKAIEELSAPDPKTCIYCGEIEPAEELRQGSDGPYHPACKVELTEIRVPAGVMFETRYWVDRTHSLNPGRAQYNRFIVD